MYSLIPVVCAQDITALVRALPGSVAQGLIWGIMAIGVFLTFKILDFADLTVDGTMATGGVVTVMLILKGWNPLAAVAVAFEAPLTLFAYSVIKSLSRPSALPSVNVTATSSSPFVPASHL